MCGIAGFTRSAVPDANLKLLERMGESIAYRGPDSHGEFLDESIGLAHRRLSIIDLSADGAQPMHSTCGRYSIVFNGEIYNFQELRQQFEATGYVFHSKTDTEVILAAYARDGRDCLKLLHGMFAFALWDKQEKTIFIARDRIGKKPLYWWHGGGDKLAFASEVKCLLHIPGIPFEVDPTAVIDYLKYLYIPAPKSIYKNIFKLLPGHFITLKMGQTPQIEQYWDVNFSCNDGLDFSSATEQLLDLIEQQTVRRMVADVPLGAFLSGGVDSSGLVALMAKNSVAPVQTCTIGFADRQHDESTYAREVAARYSTQHNEFQVSENLIDTIKLLPKYFDEPFADSSALPTYHVSRLARQKVTVALVGDGGDESFAGYQKYRTEMVENKVRYIVPKPVLRLLKQLANGADSGVRKKVGSLTSSALLDPGEGFYRTNSFVTDQQLQRLLADDLTRACQGYDSAQHTKKYWNHLQGADHVSRMLYTDIKTFLPGDILVKADRTSMAHSLELRAPLLDHGIIEYAATLPSRWKIENKQKKIILRKAFSQFLPEDFLARRKQGFTVPLASWFRGELRPFAEQLLLKNKELNRFFKTAALRQIWEQHQNHKADHGTLLWSLLSFALWQREYSV
jgi:asparagine synthase (glutamine-hydrolysing)